MSSARAKVIDQNIKGLTSYEPCSVFARVVLQHESYKGIAKTRYVNDKAITSVKEFYEALDTSKNKEIWFDVYNNGHTVTTGKYKIK